MAILHLSGTKLEIQSPAPPLNKALLFSVGVVYLIAMHFFMPNLGGTGLALSFNAMTWIAASFTLALGLYQLASNRVFRYTKLSVAFFICCLMMTIPVLYFNAKPTLVFGRIIGLWAGFLLFLLLQQFDFSNKHKQRFLWFIVLATLLESVLGLYQYYLSTDNLLGYDAIINAPYGVFQQPNVMASFLATGLILSGYLLARHPKKYNQYISEVGLLYITPLLTIPLIIVLGSKTSWFSAFIGTLFILPYLYSFSTKKRCIGWGIAIILGIGLGGHMLSSGKANEEVKNHLSLDFSHNYTYTQALDMLIEKPFTGYGYGRFESEYILYTARQHQLNSKSPPGVPSMTHPHNELLFWGIEGGIFPIVGILLMIGIVLIRIFGAQKRTRLAILALFLPITLHTQLEYPLYHSSIHWITLIIFLFWFDLRAAKYKMISFGLINKSLFRISSIILPTLTTLYMLTALHTNYVLMQFENSSPKNPDILLSATNPIVWRDRFDWNLYSTNLAIGLYNQDPKYIQAYINWSLTLIKDKPRPILYRNLILAYQGLGKERQAKQIISEAAFLFPNEDFTNIKNDLSFNDETEQSL